ncbi:MAG: hypothetical protein H7A32_02165 [Deltaproteobacteria bacterium]|nr:hypothetical protein [Deltaproteobacteria bacterium]
MKKPGVIEVSDYVPNKNMEGDLHLFWEMEMTLVNSSKDHHFFLRQMEETHDVFEKLRLHEKLDSCKELYFEARDMLYQIDPAKTSQIENEIYTQLPLSIEATNYVQ